MPFETVIPQDLRTTAEPTFANLNLTGNADVAGYLNVNSGAFDVESSGAISQVFTHVAGDSSVNDAYLCIMKYNGHTSSNGVFAFAFFLDEINTGSARNASSPNVGGYFNHRISFGGSGTQDIPSVVGLWSIITTNWSTSRNITDVKLFDALHNSANANYTGNITNFYYYKTSKNTSFGGNISNEYGLYIDDCNTGTTAYAIYTNVGDVSLGDDLVLRDVDIVLGTATGTKIGTTTSQKMGFYNATPIVQPNGTGETVGFTAGSGTGVNDDSTFTGNVGPTAYRISDIVKALKNLGLLAQ